MASIEIKHMSVSERLSVMEEIWDSLCKEATEPLSPNWHGTVLSERKREMDSPTAEFLSIAELRKRYRE